MRVAFCEAQAADSRTVDRGDDRCVLARMTGSGTTVFGLFEDELHAAIAAETITTFEPQWWVRNVILND